MRAPIVLVCAALAATAIAPPAAAQDAERRKGFAVRIVEPENQAPIAGKTRIAAEVDIDDPRLVDRVEFRVGDETVFIDREAPYETFYDFGEVSKSWVVRAIAHHIEGITVSDAVISRKIPFGALERVNRVILWVTAVDERGNLIKDLTKDDFEVYENGRPMQVLEFTREERPMNLAIVIDTSGSMVDKIEAVHDAAADFVETLRPIDRALVIDFDDNVFLLQDLTAEHAPLQEAIESTEPLGATALYDAMHASYRKIGDIEGRKAIILLSDGEDTASFFSQKRVLEEAKASDTLIYSIGVGGALGTARGVLRDFSEYTGGTSFFVKDPEELAQVYRRIADELGSQYYLTYSTDNDTWDGRWMKVEVKSERPGVDVRARRGYFAVRARK